MHLGELTGSIAFALILALFIGRVIRNASIRRSLASRRRGRTEEEGLLLARRSLNKYPPDRVALAYRWLQDLVPARGFPVYPTDRILQDLRIAQDDIDGKFEACYDCLGPERDAGAALPVSFCTAEQLMNAVLAAGYENYPFPSSVGSASAA